MDNILDLKNPPEDNSQTLTSQDEILEPESSEPGSPTEEEPLDKTEELDASIAGLFSGVGLIPEEVTWKSSVRPEALERRKEHVMMAVLVVLSVAIAIWVKSFPLAVIAFLTVLAWEVHHRTHHEMDMTINAKGVHINGYHHSYGRLESFSIQQLPDDSWHLSIKPSSTFAPLIRAPLGEQDHKKVRLILTNYIIEEEHPVPISELFLKS